jgi:cardiolipin synthase
MLESSIKRLAQTGLEHTGLARRATKAAAKDAAKLAGADAAKTSARKVVVGADRAAVKEITTKAEAAVLKNPTLRNKVTFHVNAADSHAAMLESIRTAEKSFYIETFIWHNDATGNEVIQALGDRIKRAEAEGKPFDAKVLIDWFGLRQGTGGASDVEIVQKLRAAGVDTIEFARSYVDDAKLIPITHRKFYIKDGTSFMTGGRNIGDEYGKATFTNPKGTVEPAWHDLLYTVEGEETGRIIDQFYRNWKRAGGAEPLVKPEIRPSVTGRTKIESFITDPHEKIRTLAKAHLDLVANAEREIVVMYPYLSDDKFVKALVEAKTKNPKLAVKVILPANKEASAEGGVYSLLNKETARQLMKVGIEVRMNAGGELEGKAVNRFSHFKGMVIDRKIVSVGSANGDARTFARNHELNTVIADTKTAADFLAQVADKDWATATPLTQADLKADTVWVRLKQRALELFDFLL